MKKLFILLVLAMLLPNVYAKKPLTLFLVGDETMAELTQPEDVTDSAAVGWGQMLPKYLPDDAIVENHAVDGATTKSFISEGQWQEVTARIKRGNVVMIQFGHHEYDEEDYRHFSTIEYFENNLLQMIKEAQKKGAKVVLLTPTAKNFFKDTVLYPRHGGYAEAVRRVAAHAHLPLIDVDDYTTAFIENRGEEGAAEFFADTIRLNEEGAKQVAKMVAQSAAEQKIKGF